MVNDHLSDFVTRIRNGYKAGLSEVRAPYTKSIAQVAEVLVGERYASQAVKEDNQLVVKLKYEAGKPVIMGIKRSSKPGNRVYKSIDNMPKVWGGLGINIISTTKGIISDKNARKLNVGGELICQVW